MVILHFDESRKFVSKLTGCDENQGSVSSSGRNISLYHLTKSELHPLNKSSLFSDGKNDWSVKLRSIPLHIHIPQQHLSVFYFT